MLYFKITSKDIGFGFEGNQATLFIGDIEMPLAGEQLKALLGSGAYILEEDGAAKAKKAKGVKAANGAAHAMPGRCYFHPDKPAAKGQKTCHTCLKVRRAGAAKRIRRMKAAEKAKAG